MIIGLTDRGPALPQIGVLRKGGPKPQNGNKPGADLHHFRFDSDDPVATELFRQIYGAEPRAIRVFVPFKTADENFEAWKESWTTSSLQHRCDGQTMVRWLTQRGTYSDEPKACPGGCKQVGRLKLIVPELRRLAYVTALTTSIHDILEIHANLKALEGVRGDLRGIPLILRRAPRKISTPGENGKRARREKWLLTVEAQPQWVELQLAAQEREALPAAEALALPEWNGDDEGDEEENGQAEIVAPAKPVADPREALIERMKSVFADMGKTAEWPAYERQHVEGQTADRLTFLLRRLEEHGSKRLIEEVEGPLFKSLGEAGVDGKEALEKVAQIADGECGLEQMDYATLVNVRDGLKAWQAQIDKEAALVAPF